MPIFYLEPIDRNDQSWDSTRLKEACWVDATCPAHARGLVAIMTAEIPRLGSGTQIPLSPWMNNALSHCQLDIGNVIVPGRAIVTVAGQTIKEELSNSR
jgi:hypothetical protein